MNRHRSIWGALCGAAGVMPPPVFAPGHPARPIRFVVPCPPGGGTDVAI